VKTKKGRKKARAVSEPLLGERFRKIHPKLRMIANGRFEVNKIRADFSSSIRVAEGFEIDSPSPVQNIAQFSAPAEPKKTGLKKVTKGIETSVFVQRVTACPRDIGPRLKGRHRNAAETIYGEHTRGFLSTATINLSELSRVAGDESISWVEPGEPLKAPTPVVSDERVRKPKVGSRRFDRNNVGKNVLIGIIDVQGFDFAHPDFLTSDKRHTRFERIWDQGGTTRPGPAAFGYGAEIRKTHMDAAIKAADSTGLTPQQIEPRSQMAPASHGTHVASIAAGNLGVCRGAFLAGVLIALPDADLDRRRSFYDSTRIAHAVEYLFEVANELCSEYGLDELPLSINISLGTNGHAHDASSAVSRWVDSALTIPGRSVCVASGNAGQEAPQTEDDIGYIMGRIHTSGRIAARGLDADIEWIVVGNTIEDMSENELEIWYSPADRFAVSVKPPGMDWTEPIAPMEFIENRQLDDGSYMSIYNELYHPANGANFIALYLSPCFSSHGIKGVSPGTWHVRLHGLEVRDGRYHGWIERDDPRRLGRHGTREFWQFPSFFSEVSNIDNSSVSSLACGHRVVSVANLDEKVERMNVTSSQGPTRDERHKPDVAAPGTGIVAARGFSEDPKSPWVAMSGTSMASPYVAGVIGLMLSRKHDLTAAQIGGIIQRTAKPLPGVDFTWQNDAGYGVIDPKACLAEIDVIERREDRT